MNRIITGHSKEVKEVKGKAIEFFIQAFEDYAALLHEQGQEFCRKELERLGFLSLL
jgi:hypothetical protein